jgi:hypothetical protein
MTSYIFQSYLQAVIMDAEAFLSGMHLQPYPIVIEKQAHPLSNTHFFFKATLNL